ncbi:MAG: IS630 family transposase [Deltaproteobacteria bacterium]|nr:IS630 family transposase [Deltaproteobacteria bacterium]
MVRQQRAPHVLVMRARLILKALRGLGTTEIARQLGIDPRTVRKWKARFAEDRHVHALDDRQRSGRPNSISIALRCRLVQLACDRPENEERPAAFRDVWTYASLADALEHETGRRISTSEVGRILRFEGLRPHRVRQWLKSTDPEFDAKAKRVCKLYLRPPKGAVVVCVDEKPLQVLERKHPTHVDPRDGSVRYEYEYKRHGIQALLAAFDIQTGHVFGRVVPSRNAQALVSFMNALARKYPGKQVYVVWDNLNIHYDGKDDRWTSFNARHDGRFHFVYTPKHASWMNQVEIWFSILQRRVIRHGDFVSPEAQRRRILGFIWCWNRREKHPFRWTWRANKAQNRRLQAA